MQSHDGIIGQTHRQRPLRSPWNEVLQVLPGAVHHAAKLAGQVCREHDLRRDHSPVVAPKRLEDPRPYPNPEEDGDPGQGEEDYG